MAAGRLFLVPAWLSEGTAPETVVPAAALERIRALDRFVAEDAKSARAWLAVCRHPRPLREVDIEVLDEHTPRDAIEALLAPVLAGRDTGVVSEAGVPAVADPGALLVAAAHAGGVSVIPLVGPSSILLALMASGLEGQRFRFLGYLPTNPAERRARLVQIERDSARHSETQIFIETPYRNDALLGDIVESCKATTRLCVAAELTSEREWIRSGAIAKWREDRPTIGKRPAIFLLLA
jgi:16S rRNA (cytidine1402-2'-O)-methyltransferase